MKEVVRPTPTNFHDRVTHKKMKANILEIYQLPVVSSFCVFHIRVSLRRHQVNSMLHSVLCASSIRHPDPPHPGIHLLYPYLVAPSSTFDHPWGYAL